jgi:predicted dehydrogenase
VCENFRYQESFSRAHYLAESGIVGEIRGYYLNDVHYTPPTGMYAVTAWRTRGMHRGGYILDGGSHIIAGLRAMVGETPAEVSASGLSFHPDHLGRPWDTVFANLSFASGKRGHLTLGYGSPDKEARHPKLLGTEGTIALFKDRLEVWRLDGTADEVFPLTSSSSGIPEEWQDFLSTLTDHKPLRYSAWESVRDLAVFDAIMESCEIGSPIGVQVYGADDV